MSPRPRKASDEQIFAGAYRAMTRLGPNELTLAAIAKESGVTAGAIVQRFGSKRKLLIALAEGAAHSAGDFIRGLRAKHRSPLATLRDYATCMAGLAQTPAALARNLAYLTNDLADPDLRKNLLVQSRGTRTALQELVEEAIARGELEASTDAKALARTIETVVSGALFSWAVYREGTAERYLRDHLEAVLAAHLPDQPRP